MLLACFGAGGGGRVVDSAGTLTWLSVGFLKCFHRSWTSCSQGLGAGGSQIGILSSVVLFPIGYRSRHSLWFPKHFILVLVLALQGGGS